MSENQIYTYIKRNNETSVSEISEAIGFSRQYIHRVLNKLVEDKKIKKIGTPPKVFYKISELVPSAQVSISIDADFLNKHFLLFTEYGERKQGVEGLIYWCNKHKLPFSKTESEYIKTRKKYLEFYNSFGLIDGTSKLKSTKELTGQGIDRVYYADFYAIERFAKTWLGWLIHVAKQTSNIQLMKEIIEIVRPLIYQLIVNEKIEAVGYIPPTIKREIQIMKVLERRLNIPLPHIGIVKVKSQYMIPQKSLTKMDERVNNAQSSIVLGKKAKYDRVLLIDDAIGSGATIFETAKKIKHASVAKVVIGFAITGSYKGFEVIQGV